MEVQKAAVLNIPKHGKNPSASGTAKKKLEFVFKKYAYNTFKFKIKSFYENNF